MKFVSRHRKIILGGSLLGSVVSLSGFAVVGSLNWTTVTADYMEIPGCLLQYWHFLAFNSLVLPGVSLALAWLAVLDNETAFSATCFVLAIAMMVLPLVILVLPVVILWAAFLYALASPI